VWKFQCTPLRASGLQTLEPGAEAVHMELTASTCRDTEREAGTI
jgi:hypothetical protein